MQYSAWLSDINDLRAFQKISSLKEVWIQIQGLSRLGTAALPEAKNFAAAAQCCGFRTVLVADRPVHEERHQQGLALLRAALPSFTALAVSDLSWLEFLSTEKALARQVGIQINCEHGNRNSAALQAYRDFCIQKIGSTPEKLLLSPELSRTEIFALIRKIDVPLEILGLGPLLLAETPRKLLSAANLTSQEILSSSEPPGLRLCLTEYGDYTGIFSEQRFCLLEYAAELFAAGLKTLRLDLRFDDPAAKTGILEKIQAQDFSTWPREWLRPFYLGPSPSARTLTTKLPLANLVAQIIAAKRNSYAALKFKQAVKLNQVLQLKFGNGKIFKIPSLNFFDSAGVNQVSAKAGDILYCSWFKYAAPGANVCLA